MPITMASLEKTKTAVIVVDVQNDFCAPDGAMGKMGKDLRQVETSVAALESFLGYCRSNQFPILFVQTKHSPVTDSPNWTKRLQGKQNAVGICRTPWGQEFYKVQPEEQDVIITKHRYSAFVGTNLEMILRSKGIENLVLCGVATNVCVEGTARDGFMKDFTVITVSDCTASYSRNEYDSAIFNLNTYFGTVASSQELCSPISLT